MAVKGHSGVADFCHHWYLTFDGNKCANPDTIEVLDYSATAGDLYRATDSRSINNNTLLNIDCLLPNNLLYNTCEYIKPMLPNVTTRYCFKHFVPTFIVDILDTHNMLFNK